MSCYLLATFVKMLIKEMRILHLEGFMNMPARKIYIYIYILQWIFYWRREKFVLET
jgi:hypothetical protein